MSENPLTDPVAAEMAALRTEMSDLNGPYWVGPLAEAKQSRYRDLIAARARWRAAARRRPPCG
jgi:hypothetical protein